MLCFDLSIIFFDGFSQADYGITVTKSGASTVVTRMLSMNIDLSDINVFISVAELKNMTAAAKQLNYLQSNITAKIKKIENHYKRQLFIRHAKGVELNEAGIQIYQQYKKMMLTWEEAEFKVFQHEKKLRFGTNTSLGGMYFYPTLKELYAVYPKLEIKLKMGETSVIENEIIQGHIDLGYILGYPSSNQIDYILKSNEELVLIGKTIRSDLDFPACMEQQNMIISSENCCYAQTLDTLFQSFQCTKGDLIQIYDHEAMIQFTQIGMGISIVTRSVVNKFNLHYYRQLPEHFRHIGLYLISRKNHVFTNIEKRFIRLNDRCSNNRQNT